MKTFSSWHGSMIDDTEYALLDRYLAGECSPAELQHVERWLAPDDSRGRVLEWMRTLKERATSQGNGAEAEEMWRGLRERMRTLAQANELTSVPTVRRSTPRFSMSVQSRWPARHGWAVAAALAAGVAAVVVWQTIAGEPAGSVTPRTYSTARAQRTTVRLHDGTRVTLAASSALDVRDTYGRRSREVHLTGEAYFEVAADPNRPFRVRSGNAVAQAIGTKFGVRAYSEDHAVAVVVEEGAVAVGFGSGGTPRERVVLSGGDLAKVEPGGRVLIERDVAVRRYLGWVQGRLEFVDAPLSDAAREIGRWYDVDVVVDDSALARGTLTASFSNERLDEVVSAVAASVEARAEYDGRTVRLFPLR